VLCLSDHDLIAEGHERRVYRHPEANRALLVKTVIPRRRRHAWLRSFGPNMLYESFRREVRAYLEAVSEEGGQPRHLQTIVGFVPTNMGLGMAVESVGQTDEAVGRTLEALATEGRSPDITAALDRFCRWVTRTRVVVHDLNPRNIVLGREDFVLVDGFGTRTLVPVREYSPWLNRQSGAKRAAALMNWYNGLERPSAA
jgi:hypothetical protein